jgi:recombination protein RecA
MAAKKKSRKNDTKAAVTDDSGGHDNVVSAVVSSMKKLVDDFDVANTDSPRRYFDSGSYALNWAMSDKSVSGGYPGGRVVEVFGDPSTGKSVLVYSLMANVTKNGGYVVIDDTENSYTDNWTTDLGVVNDRVIPIRSETVEGHANAAMKMLTLLRKKVGPDTPIVIALDSLAGLSTEHEKSSDMTKADMSKAKMVKKAMRLMGISMREDHNTLYLVTNHVIANIGNMYDRKRAPGGGGLPFHSSVRVELEARGNVVEEGTKRLLGVDSFVCVRKNKVMAPGRKCRIRIMYDSGIVLDHNLFEVAKAAGVCRVVTSNGWCEMDGHDGRFQESGFWRDGVWEKAVKLLDHQSP